VVRALTDDLALLLACCFLCCFSCILFSLSCLASDCLFQLARWDGHNRLELLKAFMSNSSQWEGTAVAETLVQWNKHRKALIAEENRLRSPHVPIDFKYRFDQFEFIALIIGNDNYNAKKHKPYSVLFAGQARKSVLDGLQRSVITD
jgi:hypothetical protein